MVADVLSQMPRISVMMVAHHKEFAEIKNNYNANGEFGEF